MYEVRIVPFADLEIPYYSTTRNFPQSGDLLLGIETRMRPPLAGDAVAPLPRKSSGTQGSAGSQAFAGQGTETTYFIADEKAMEATGLEPSEPRPPTGMHATTFGVQSLSDTVEEASLVHEVDRGPQEGDSDDARAKQRLQSSPKSITSQLRSIRTSELQTSLAQPESPPQPSLQSGQWSRSPSLQLLTPSLPLSPAPEPSLPSSPRSVSSRWLRPEDSGSTVDDSASQAVVSSDEDEAEMPAENQHSAPQLIMPSIKMPSRRPFTEHGKAMGRFKVLLAGGSGTSFRASDAKHHSQTDVGAQRRERRLSSSPSSRR